MNANLPKNCWECPFFKEPATCIHAGRQGDGTISPEFRGPKAPLRPAWCPLSKKEG